MEIKTDYSDIKWQNNGRLAGLRSDFDEVTYRRRRYQILQENNLLLHYDNLYDSALDLNNRKSF